MSPSLPIDERVTIPASDLVWTAVRSSGPGGQNVNKVASRVELRFALSVTRALDDATKARLRALGKRYLDADGDLLVKSDLTRDQSRNLEDALQKLRDLVRQALVVPRRRRATRPSLGSKRRRLEDKRRTSEKKRDRRGE